MTARRIGTVATLVLLTASAGACSGRTQAQRPTRLARFSQFGLTFTYPAAWNAQTWPTASSFSTLITYLSPQQLSDPCTPTQNAERIQIDCGWPIPTLPPGGVLVSWSGVGFPGQGPAVTSPNTTIGNQPARFSVDRPGMCGPISADETMTADIERPKVPNNYIRMMACLRGPGLQTNERLVKAMLSSTHVMRP